MAPKLFAEILLELKKLGKEKNPLFEKSGYYIKYFEDALRGNETILNDAFRNQVYNSAAKEWLQEFKNAMYDLQDVLDEWEYEVVRCSNNKPNRSKKKAWYRFFMSKESTVKEVPENKIIPDKLEEIQQRLSKTIASCPAQKLSSMVSSEHKVHDDHPIFESVGPAQELSSMVSCEQEVHDDHPIFEPVVFGRAQDVEVLKTYLLKGSSQDANNPEIISIVGKAGIGKTAFAKLLYNHPEVKSHFEHRVRIKCYETNPIVEELKSISAASHGKKFLLVVDDVWTENPKDWEYVQQFLKAGAKGSRILVTTQKDVVAKMSSSIHTYKLKELQQEYCWYLFKNITISRDIGWKKKKKKKLEVIGKKLVEKCNGLPLAVVALERSIPKPATEESWEPFLSADLWDLKEARPLLTESLLRGYNDLPPAIQQCLLYCTIFRKGTAIRKDDLIKLWMAQGYLAGSDGEEMETIGEDYFERLLACSFVEEIEHDSLTCDVVSCKLHYIVYDIAMMECLGMDAEAQENAEESEIRKATYNGSGAIHEMSFNS